MEYREAQRQDKLVIPLEYQPCSKVPIELNDIQWVNFERTYEQELKDLLIVLSRFDSTVGVTPQTMPEVVSIQPTQE